MRDDDYGRLGLAAATLALAALCYLATCGTAEAAPYVLKFRNPDTNRAYTSLRTPWGIVAAPCAPGATCSVALDLPFGRRSIKAEATVDSVTWSPTSNTITALIFPTAVECLAIPACAHDSDRDGMIGGTDFESFVGAFGTSWIPAQ